MQVQPTNPRTALITGTSSGFGLLTAVTLAKRGWRVIATMRDLDRRTSLEDAATAASVLDRIEILPLDINNQEQIAALAATLAARAVPLHAVVNNAGCAVAGFADDVSDAELRQQFDTNFFAHAAVTRAVLPQLRRQGFGHIVMVSSISGRNAFPGLGSYVASKHALEGWTETLRLEMLPLGIHVALVEPGSFQTGIWTRGTTLSACSLEAQRWLEAKSPDTKPPQAVSLHSHFPNAARMAQLIGRVRNGKRLPDAQIVADRIARILETPRPRLRHVVGRDARLVLVLRALLPWRLFERFLIKASGITK
jgi:NAD(P)-dependent dehydrogenase (short-subunit alcohol dehydrogenase family)